MNETIESQWLAMNEYVLAQMRGHVQCYLSPVSTELGDDAGELSGTGNYVEFGGAVYLLTNEHVVRECLGKSLCHQFYGSDLIYKTSTLIVADPHPIDLAIARVPDEIWVTKENQAQAVPSHRFAAKHQPVEGELLFLVGYSGERSKFFFGCLNSPGTPYLTQECDLPNHEDCNPTFHFALPYRPDLAQSAEERSPGLPVPPGLSGSLVWNTRFVECMNEGKDWKPEEAQVTGLLWGWPSSEASLVVTRVEHLNLEKVIKAYSQMPS